MPGVSGLAEGGARRAPLTPGQSWTWPEPPGGLLPGHVGRGRRGSPSPQSHPHTQVQALEAENRRRSRELAQLQAQGAQDARQSRQKALELQGQVAEAQAAREAAQEEVGRRRGPGGEAEGAAGTMEDGRGSGPPRPHLAHPSVSHLPHAVRPGTRTLSKLLQPVSTRVLVFHCRRVSPMWGQVGVTGAE